MDMIVGADSKIGRGLCNYLSLLGEKYIETTRRKDGRLFLDLSQNVSSFEIPDVTTAYLCAAVTYQSDCKNNPEETKRVNVDNTILLAERLLKQNIFVVFLSSNLVYSGDRPYQHESENVSPKTEYGRQKALVEKALEGRPGVAIVRCTKVISGNNLLSSWRESLQRGEAIHPFSDLVMSPVPLTLVTYTLHKIGKLKVPGIFQISGKSDVSYADVAIMLARHMKADINLVQPVTSHGSGNNLEHVHKFSTLDTSRLKKVRTLPIPTIDRMIELVT